jgi:hypothetical protein
MSTSQRVQVLLKPKALDIVKQLSEELDLTLSKTVAMLVYEALETRGVKVRPSSSVLTDIPIPDNVTKELVTKKSEPQSPTNAGLPAIDEDFLKKIKMLQELGLLPKP